MARPGRDIDPVAKPVAILDDDLSDIEPNAELHPIVG